MAPENDGQPEAARHVSNEAALGTDRVTIVPDANTCGRGHPDFPSLGVALQSSLAGPRRHMKRLDNQFPKVELCFARFGP